MKAATPASAADAAQNQWKQYSIGEGAASRYHLVRRGLLHAVFPLLDDHPAAFRILAHAHTIAGVGGYLDEAEKHGKQEG